MKQIYVLIAALITVILFDACKKKDLPEAEEGNAPQFYFTGNVNGTNYNLQAGVSDYYMYSGFNQSTVTNVYGFTAALKQNSCTTCNNSIQIEINDYRYSSYNGPSGIDSAFQSTFYPYCMGTWAPVTYSMSFYPWFNNTAVSYLWNFGDGSTSALPYPSHVYKHPGDYNVSLTVTDNFSCSNTVSNIHTFGPTDNLCRTTITVTSASTLNATYSHVTSGTGPYNFLWDFGDASATSTLSTPSHTYSSQGRYPVSLRVIDSNNDTAVANVNYVTSGSNMCTTNYFVINDTALVNTNGVSNIIIKWTDSNGIEYSSNSSLQPPTSYFKIVSVSDYHTNEQGQKTKKLHIRFKCNVYNGTASLPIDNGDAVVVVAYQ
jgi:PKD repeat protein